MISKSFYLWFIAATLVLLSAAYGLSLVKTVPVLLYIAIVLIGGLSLLLYRYILKENQKSPRRFVTAFMASVTIKLLFTAGLVGVAVYFDKENKVVLALGMFVIYIAYTLVMVRSLTSEVTNKTHG
ncbi:MAG: hypothetical protein ACOYLH_05415 [Flavobacteriales bacterium]